MTKTKKAVITPKQEADARRIISRMTPEELEMMDAFEKEFARLPEEIQDTMLEFVQRLISSPEGKRKEILDKLDELASYFPADDSDGLEDDELDCGEYQHFVPSEKVLKYTLRVTLKEHKPAIYRKFCVPSNISLRHLSELIIGLMGWDGYHLNQFRKGNDCYAPACQREDDMPGLFEPVSDNSQEDYSLADILSVKGKTIEWEYDFGDSWLHEVRLSSISEYGEDEPLVSFVKGEYACPPEDCGGVWGYEELLEIYDRFQRYTMSVGRKPSNDDLDRLRWHGMSGDFNPDEYDTSSALEICEAFCR